MKNILLRKMLEFIKRDFLQTISYRLTFLMQFVGIFASVFLWYFISRLFGGSIVQNFKQYGGDYFSFVIIGVAFLRFFDTALDTFSSKITEEQFNGSLESMLTTQTPASQIVIFSSLFPFILSSFQIVVYFVIGSFFIHVNILKCNIMLPLLALVLTTVSVSGIGIIAASFTIIFKRTGYIITFVSILFQLFGGVYYPVTVMPMWLQKLSCLIPITYSLDIARKVLLQRLGWEAVASDFYALLLFAAVLFPLSLMIFEYSVKKAKIQGSLSNY